MTKNKAKLIIFTGPSGVGKGTMLADFFKRVDNNIVYSISNKTLFPLSIFSSTNFLFVP